MNISDDIFEESINIDGLVLVDFWAEWCEPCKKLSPILEDISKETGLKVLKINVDNNPKKTQEYGVSSIPTMVLFNNGKPVKTITGAKPKHLLMKDLSEWI